MAEVIGKVRPTPSDRYLGNPHFDCYPREACRCRAAAGNRREFLRPI
ncbi:MAG: hypothetical protein ACE15C_06715 [Phycisphaerae bacterium]